MWKGRATKTHWVRSITLPKILHSIVECCLLCCEYDFKMWTQFVKLFTKMFVSPCVHARRVCRNSPFLFTFPFEHWTLNKVWANPCHRPFATFLFHKDYINLYRTYNKQSNRLLFIRQSNGRFICFASEFDIWTATKIFSFQNGIKQVKDEFKCCVWSQICDEISISERIDKLLLCINILDFDH